MKRVNSRVVIFVAMITAILLAIIVYRFGMSMELVKALVLCSSLVIVLPLVIIAVINKFRYRK